MPLFAVQRSFEQRLLGTFVDGLDLSRRDACHDRPGRDIPSHHCTGRHDCVIPDAHPRKDRRLRADPYPFPQADGCRIGRLAASRGKTMVERSENHLMADLATIAYVHPSMILKVAASIDKDLLAEVDVPAEIGIERRENPQRRIYRAAKQTGKQLPHLIGRMKRSIQLEGDATSLFAHPVHKIAYFRGIECPTRPDVFQKLFQRHLFLLDLQLISLGQILLPERPSGQSNDLHRFVFSG